MEADVTRSRIVLAILTFALLLYTVGAPHEQGG
jgi:hypothetical protein